MNWPARLLLASMCMLASVGARAADAASDACVAHSTASLEALVQGDFAVAGKTFSAQTAASLPSAKIEQVWDQVQQYFGAYQSHAAPRRQVLQGKPVVVTPVSFAKGPLDFVTACDDADRITMFLLLKPSAVDARAPVQPRVEADGVRVEPLDVPSPSGPLRGALTLPPGDGPFPAMVLVAGSGPNDLDETVGASKPFRDIAEGLARAGIATLRYDKRTYDYAADSAGDPDFSIDDEVTDDALSALRLLAKQEHVDPHRVFVLGHSQGAMLAPRIATRDAGLAGVVMLAAPARSLLDVLVQQTREQGRRQGEPQDEVDKHVQAIENEKALLAKADPAHPPRGSFGGAPQAWWLSLHRYDQVAVAKSLSLPMLILQGGSDFQVSPENDFDAWKTALAGKSNVTLRRYPGLGHLFTPADKTQTPADYERPAHVDPRVIRDIAAWIKAQPPR